MVYDGSKGCVLSCSDGTLFGSCVLGQATYCNPTTGKLESNCTKCECPTETPLCKSDGKTCYTICTGTDCIPGNVPYRCVGGAPTQDCNGCGGCPGTHCVNRCIGHHVCMCCTYYGSCETSGVCLATNRCDCEEDSTCGGGPGGGGCPPNTFCPV
jgi:hypothetical protein